MTYMYRITPSLLERLSSRVASRFVLATGNGTRVGLFIRVPEELAEQFPERPAEDDSPPHVTLLYVGDVPKNLEERFITVLQEILGGWGKFQAAFDGVDHFVHPEKDRRVYFSRVKFDRDLGSLRDRITSKLEEEGFEVSNSFPLAFNPHATLAYVPGLDSEYTGPVPEGHWDVEGVEVWGLPGEHVIDLGGHHLVHTKKADKIPGGIGDKKKPSDFDPKQVSKGVTVEMEHTDDPDLAKEIAVDHLTEDPKYYDKLETIEKHSSLWGETLPVKEYPLGFHPELIDRGIQVESRRMAKESSEVILDTVLATLADDIHAYK